jgi:hypothetical protein
MDKNIWGSSMWNFIHIVALGFPDNADSIVKQDYKSYYENIYLVIPCGECSKHYKETYQKYKIDDFLKDKNSLFEWTVNMHNIVNKMLSKKIISLTSAKSKFYKNNNFDSKFWTDSIWKIFHYISFGYPENPSSNNKQSYKEFYENLYKILPYKEYSDNYIKTCKEIPIDNYLKSKDTLFEWTIKFHNNINTSLNKKNIDIKYAKCIYKIKPTNYYYIKYFCFLLIILLILFAIYMHKKYNLKNTLKYNLKKKY